MEYTVFKYRKEELVKLQVEWEKLEKGTEMTYFQFYHWNEMLTAFTPDGGAIEVVYYQVKDAKGNTVLIAPLWIIKSTVRFLNKKGVYLIGRQGWSDYLNLVYDKFIPLAFDTLILTLKKEYKLSSFYFEYIKEGSSLYQYVQSRFLIKEDTVITCVHLQLPGDVESYYKMLSKHARQNIRTAKNRLEKEGMHISYCFDDRPDLELCKQMRALRVANKEFKKLETYSLLRKLKSFLRRRLTVYFPNYLPLCDDRKSRFLTAYINNELASFFNYGYDVYHQEVVMMAVGLNEKYRSYSPGILLLYEYIQQQITEKELKLIDFTRGTEKYKYTLGGVDHAIHNVMFEV